MTEVVNGMSSWEELDKDFLAAVESLYALDPEQIKGIQAMLKAFNKDL